MTPTIATLDQDQQRRHDMRNTLHTWLLILGAGVLMAVIAWMTYGVGGIVWAAIFGGLGLWSASKASPKLVLKLYRARPIAPNELIELQTLIRDLTARADLPAVPTLHYIPSKMMNAFAVGRPEDSAIAVTDGLLRNLTLRQLAGVLAHEVSHIRSGDLKVMALGDILNRITSFMATFGLFGLIFSIPAMLTAGIKVPWLGLLFLLLAPTMGGLLQLALSRAREYDADLDAADLTGDPEGLALALQILERKQGHMWEGIVLPGGRSPEPSILRSHPKTADRVQRLLSLKKDATPHVTIRDTRHQPDRSIVPIVRPPRIHWHRMGLWY
ncbi:MAG: zinc metalloprotease HtpX [Hyphomicrobiales bacterium]|nr:zinc metalloprotease HtpX [Hyphomicrobiales bacterium]